MFKTCFPNSDLLVLIELDKFKSGLFVLEIGFPNTGLLVLIELDKFKSGLLVFETGFPNPASSC